MDKKFVAKQAVVINAPSKKVWDALANPEIARQYMFGTNAITDWKNIKSIFSQKDPEIKSKKEKGTLLKIEPEHLIKYSYYSPLSGLPERPENFNTVTVELSDAENHTILLLAQDNNPTKQARDNSKKNWRVMLTSFKNLLEKQTLQQPNVNPNNY